LVRGICRRHFYSLAVNRLTIYSRIDVDFGTPPFWSNSSRCIIKCVVQCRTRVELPSRILTRVFIRICLWALDYTRNRKLEIVSYGLLISLN